MNKKYLSAASQVLSPDRSKKSVRPIPQHALDNISHMDLYTDAPSTELSYYSTGL